MSTNNTYSSTTVTSTITEYPVGYCKPPKTGQFQPGQSGNLKGRPKGSQNFTTILEKELNNKIQIKILKYLENDIDNLRKVSGLELNSWDL